jgi:hypothetical protein
MKSRTPQEDKNWKFALESIGYRVWSNTDMYFAMAFGGVCGFCMGLIIWMIVKYT